MLCVPVAETSESGERAHRAARSLGVRSKRRAGVVGALRGFARALRARSDLHASALAGHTARRRRTG